ncbi:JAB domain-containing protein [Dysgonomonas sp.]|jgi:DNA repair protein RadC|uniref:JAB domain-containing protein n=1 Tax=Dysgonomonas sp. TaxID=1891233 RepID=UPI00281C21C9|nr:JAB domain-containing protein [Dysgonomonas sp.]MDR2001688.1 JAB domain-containing protein [Prevotella sp.]HMM04268.1 JAB domain-containing protein [Dysgonomonas sp.]
MENLFTVNEVKLTYKTKQKASERPKILSSESVYKILLNCFDADTIEYREYFKVLLLNRTNQVLGVFNVSEGGISETVVDIRLILQSAILSNASGIILCHNHPSGNINPSSCDDNMTRKIKEACKIIDISLLDHIIITSESYYSYADEGRL